MDESLSSFFHISFHFPSERTSTIASWYGPSGVTQQGMPGLSSAAAAAAAASVGYYGAPSIYTNQALEQQYIYTQFLAAQQSGLGMGGIPGYPVGGFYGYGDGHAYASAGLPPPAAALSTYGPTPTILPRRIQSFANMQQETAYNPAAAALQNAGYYSGMLPPSAHVPASYATAASLQSLAIKNEKVLNQDYYNSVPKVRYRSIQSRFACSCDFSHRCSSAHAVYHHNPTSSPGTCVIMLKKGRRGEKKGKTQNY